MKAIIVDDEPKAISLLVSYLNHFQTVELVGRFRNGLKAFQFLQENSVDLVFLDINMPHLSGLSLAKMIPKNTQVIFTTAHAEHAVESYELQAADYLLKPISFERFAKAISRLIADAPMETLASPDLLSVKSGSNVFRIPIAEIQLLKKDGNYLYYMTASQQVLARQSVAEALANLPPWFMQVHKSYIVNLRQVHHYNKQEIVVAKHAVPIGQAFRKGFFSRVDQE